MPEITPEVHPEQDNPFHIGKRPVDTLASFATLIKAQVTPRTTLTTAELEDLSKRDTGLALGDVQSFITKRLGQADRAREYNANPFRTRETETELLYDGVVANEEMMEKAEGVAKLRGKTLCKGDVPLEAGGFSVTMFSPLSNEKIGKAYRTVTGFKNEEEVYRTVSDMIKAKKYNEVPLAYASGLL